MSPTGAAWSSLARRGWRSFRRWPTWGQVIAWLLFWWLLIPLFAWKKARTRAGHVVAAIVSLATVAAFVGTAVLTSQQPKAAGPRTSTVANVPLLPASPENPTARTSNGSPARGAIPCPSNPLLGVYDPSRLTVLLRCQWYLGVVAAVRPEQDGDHHVDVVPDRGYARFLNQGDRVNQLGALLVEIMPGQRMPIPSVGDHVAIFGTWVFDTIHGWNEVHPLWAMRFLATGQLIVALPPATPRYNP